MITMPSRVWRKSLFLFAIAISLPSCMPSLYERVLIQNEDFSAMIEGRCFRTNANCLLSTKSASKFSLSPPGSLRFSEDAQNRKARTAATYQYRLPQYVSVMLPPTVEFKIARLIKSNEPGKFEMEAIILNGDMAGLTVDVSEFFTTNDTTSRSPNSMKFAIGPFVSLCGAGQKPENGPATQPLHDTEIN